MAGAERDEGTLDAEIDLLKRRLDELRPLSAESVAALDAWYEVELTYTSNAIEGNTLTRLETAVVLEKGITVAGKPLRDHLEAVGHKAALDYVHTMADRDEPVLEADIRAIHRLVLMRFAPDEAGAYSSYQRAIAGSQATFPPPAQIAPEMANFAAWLRTAPLTYDTAFEAHYRLVTIHSFSDGNGRTARLLMNLLLFRTGFPPVTIGPEQRVPYLSTLETRQLTSEAAPYRAFMKERLIESLKHYVTHIEKAVS
jgi:Fic family protein